MSQRGKHRPPTSQAEAVAPPASASPAERRRLVTPIVLGQTLVVVGLSSVLGFAFNSANPLGVQLGEPTVTAPTVSAETTAAPIQTTNPVPAITPAPINPGNAALQPRPVPTHTPPATTPPVAPPPTVAPTVPVASPVVGHTNPAPIHWPEAKALVAAGRAIMVDVRHKPLYDAGHIPGAISLPEISPPEEFRAFLQQQPADRILIVYCSSTSCSQSARVATRLVTEFQWPAVRYMTGGYLEYQQALQAERANAPASPSP